MTRDLQKPQSPDPTRIHVAERGTRTRRNWIRCELDQNITLTPDVLKTYFFAQWNPLAHDALVVAGAIEFADKCKRRPALSWAREFHLDVPVSDPDTWKSEAVSSALHDAVGFLTGDQWHIEFSKLSKPAPKPEQGQFDLDPAGTDAVIPFSNGLDSRCVSAIKTLEMGSKLVRVRLGPRVQKEENLSNERTPFISVPYEVKEGPCRFVETTARSRGFKYALVSGLAAYAANAKEVIVSESGQGALGPALVTVGQAYPDYRSHPLFTNRMERLFNALLKRKIRFAFPQLWRTKAETLRQFIESCEDGMSWVGTRSCWQSNRHASVDGKRRQCGVCAACMLRRLSVHAAGQTEVAETYVWENLAVADFWQGAASSFGAKHRTRKMKEYAIAGALHLDHLAAMRTSKINAEALELHAFQIAQATGLQPSEAQRNLNRLLTEHGREWKSFVTFLGPKSFISGWAASASA